MRHITHEGHEITVVDTYDIGPEAGPILDWFDTFFYALSKLRSADLKLDKSRDPDTLKDLHLCIGNLVHRLEPRMEGLITALIRAHHEAGGSHQELATAMDVARSTASTRVRTTRKHPPANWEEWARGQH